MGPKQNKAGRGNGRMKAPTKAHRAALPQDSRKATAKRRKTAQSSHRYIESLSKATNATSVIYDAAFSQLAKPPAPLFPPLIASLLSGSSQGGKQPKSKTAHLFRMPVRVQAEWLDSFASKTQLSQESQSKEWGKSSGTSSSAL